MTDFLAEDYCVFKKLFGLRLCSPTIPLICIAHLCALESSDYCD